MKPIHLIPLLVLPTLAIAGIAIHARQTSHLTPTYISKGQIVAHNDGESTPLALPDGRLVAMLSRRTKGIPTSIQFTDARGTEIANIAWPYGYASAVVDGDVVRVFGTRLIPQSTNDVAGPVDQKGEVGMLVLDAATLHKKESKVLFTRPNRVFNTSMAIVGADDKAVIDGIKVIGKLYVLAVEDESAGHGGQFYPKFYVSEDLVDWAPVGATPRPGKYEAAPTLRRIEGWWYMFYTATYKLAHPVANNQKGGPDLEYGFETRVARSRDLRTWQATSWGKEPNVLSPGADDGDGINNSDMDLVEKDGMVYMTYANGYQQQPDDVRWATFDGTLAQFVAKLF